jgi:hypothetical protein
MANSSSKEVEYSSHHPKVEGLSPNAATVTGISRWWRNTQIDYILLYYINIKILFETNRILSQLPTATSGQLRHLDPNHQTWDDEASTLPWCSAVISMLQLCLHI